ncbi:hypothetical protein ABFS82_13G054500 [Erythranthe guttata]
MADHVREPIRSASEKITTEFQTLVDSQDLDSIKQSQNLMYLSIHHLLGRLQDSSAVLSHFNDYSENCFADVSADFSKNTRLLRTMKSDLDYIFQKLRSMKGKILATYPDAFPDNSTIEALDQRPDLELAK